MRDEKAILVLCDRIRQIAFDLHVYLKHGHLEKVYENGLAHRLRKAGFWVEQKRPLEGATRTALSWAIIMRIYSSKDA